VADHQDSRWLFAIAAMAVAAGMIFVIAWLIFGLLRL
jgi:hypothetical protein